MEKKPMARPGMKGQGKAAATPTGFIRVRGLPYSATVQDVCNAFKNFRVPAHNVTMGCLARGQRAGMSDGQAYVKMANPAIAQRAADQLQGVTVGSRYLELFVTDAEDFEETAANGGMMEEGAPVVRAAPMKTGKGAGKGGKAAAPRAPRAPPAQPNSEDGVVRIRGLPFSSTKAEVAGLFAEYGVDESCIFMGLVTRGKMAGSPDGQAFIRFPSADIAQDVIANCQNLTVGSRYLEIYDSSEEDVSQQMSIGGCESGEVGEIGQPGAGFVRLRGLPYRCELSDIVAFFGQSFGITENDVTLVYGNDGRPSGEAFVELQSEESALAAQQSLNREHLGERYIEVFTASAQDVNRAARVTPYGRM